MGKRWTRRGGLGAAGEVAKAALRDRGIVRARDFQPRMNSHNWHNLLGFSLEERAPRIFTGSRDHPLPTALAPARHRNAALGLESALFVAGLLDTEPLPVRLVVRRGTRPSRFKDPPIEYHWSNTPDPEAKELEVCGIRIRVHSPARAVIDILRAREREHWPTLFRGDVDEAALNRLAGPLRATSVLSAWLVGLPTRPPKPPTPPEATPAPVPDWGHPDWW